MLNNSTELFSSLGFPIDSDTQPFADLFDKLLKEGQITEKYLLQTIGGFVATDDCTLMQQLDLLRLHPRRFKMRQINVKK